LVFYFLFYNRDLQENKKESLTSEVD